MSRRLIIRAEAELDIAEAAAWYEEREKNLGFELISEIGAAIARVAENPSLYRRIRLRPEVHRILARRFPYRVFYVLRKDVVIVFAVLHAARHDIHWKTRASQE